MAEADRLRGRVGYAARRTRRAFGVGAEAKAMVGKTPESIVAVRPLKDGVIADFDTVEMMLHYFIRKVHMQRLMAPHPRVVIGIPSGVTEVEKRAASSPVPIS